MYKEFNISLSKENYIYYEMCLNGTKNIYI